MRLDNLDNEKRADYQRRLLRGYGEVIQIGYTALETRVVQSEEGGKKQAKREQVAVPAVAEYYIGRMSPGQTSTVVTILGRVFAAAAGDEGFNLAQLPQLLDGETMTALMVAVLETDRAFVEDEWNLAWVGEALSVFLKYNDFFAVMESVNKLMSSFGETISSKLPNQE